MLVKNGEASFLYIPKINFSQNPGDHQLVKLVALYPVLVVFREHVGILVYFVKEVEGVVVVGIVEGGAE